MRRQDLSSLWDETFADEECLYPEIAPYEDVLVFAPGTGRAPIDWDTTGRLRIGVFLALGANLTAASSTWLWTDVTQYVRYQGGITAETGRADEASRVSPGRGALTFDNTDGRFSRKNPLSPYYGQLSRNTPIMVTVDPGNGAYPLLRQYVNEWPARMDKTLTEFTVPIRTGGVLRRLSQGTAKITTSIRGAVLADSNVVNYWPCEDGTSATSAASAVAGAAGMSFVGNVTPGTSVTTDSSTAPLIVLGTGVSYLVGGVTMATQTTTAWTVGGMYRFSAAVPAGATNNGATNLLHVFTAATGTVLQWGLYWKDSDDSLYLQAWTSGGSVLDVAGPVITNAMMLDCWLTVYMSVTQSGADIAYKFGVERTTSTGTTASTASGTLSAQTVKGVFQVQAINGACTGNSTVGHVWVLSRALATTENSPVYGAVNGWNGETAQARITRLCSENDVALTQSYGTVASSAMGVQAEDTFLNLLRAAEEVDGGVLYEDGFGLGFQPLAARYNQPVAMSLDFTRSELSEEPEPTDDDQRLHNQWEITRSGGSSAIYSNIDVTDGTYASSATRNLSTDAQCYQQAGWEVHIGTNPDLRWPAIALGFHRTEGLPLLPGWTVGRDYGARIQIANPPANIAATGDALDVIVEGLSERVDQFTWTAKLNTTPASQYRVFTVEDPSLGRLDTDGCTLDTAQTTTDTSLAVTTTTATSPPWTTSASDLPFDIEIAGERITVTAVSGTGVAQTLTVTRSVNGVVKAQVAGAAVHVWAPSVLAL